MASVFTLGVIVRVIDRFSAPLRSFRAMVAGHRDQLRQVGQEMRAWGRGALVAGAAVGAALTAPTLAFASLETASTQLRTTLMDSRGGLPAAFAAIERKAIELGNRLPGTTEDFIRMASILGAKGQSAEAIAGGLLEASALLGVVLKPLGVSYERTAESVAVFGKALGIAERDMVPFTDVVQRAVNLGIDIGDLTYAIARSAPSLKVLGIQGLAASKDLVPLIAMLNEAGIQGELAGTGIRNVLNALSNPEKVGKVSDVLARVGIQFNTLDKQGRFLGLRQAIEALGQLRSLTPGQFTAVMEELFGGGGDAEVAKQIITSGLAGYQAVVDRMQRQAGLQMKVEASLSTLASLFDAATGTWKNTLAEFANLITPELKAVVNWLGETAAAAGAWIKSHPTLVKWLGITLAVVAGLTLALGGLVVAVGAVMAVIGGAATAIATAVIAGLAAAVAALVVWWDGLIAAVKAFWEALKGGFGLFNQFARAWGWLTGGKPVPVDTGGALDAARQSAARARPPAGMANIQAQAAERHRDYAEILAAKRGPSTNISIGNLNLPGVRNAQDFIDAMESYVGGTMSAEAVP